MNLVALEGMKPHMSRRSSQAVLNHRVTFDANHGVETRLEQRLEPRFTDEPSIYWKTMDAIHADDLQNTLEQGTLLAGVAVTGFFEVDPGNR